MTALLTNPSGAMEDVTNRIKGFYGQVGKAEKATQACPPLNMVIQAIQSGQDRLIFEGIEYYVWDVEKYKDFLREENFPLESLTVTLDKRPPEPGSPNLLCSYQNYSSWPSTLSVSFHRASFEGCRLEGNKPIPIHQMRNGDFLYARPADPSQINLVCPVMKNPALAKAAIESKAGPIQQGFAEVHSEQQQAFYQAQNNK